MRLAAARNLLKVWALLGSLVAVLGLLGWAAGGYRLLSSVVFCTLLAAAAVYWYFDRVVMGMVGARELPLAEAPVVHSTLERLAARAGVVKPKLYVIPDGHPRALAAGRGRRGSAIALSRGLLGAAQPAELEGVLAHELAHVRSRDVLTQEVVVVIAAALVDLTSIGGFFQRALLFVLGPIAAAPVHLLLSPRREFAADRFAAELCESPHGLADGLLRLELAGELVEFRANPANRAALHGQPVRAHRDRGDVSDAPADGGPGPPPARSRSRLAREAARGVRAESDTDQWAQGDAYDGYIGRWSLLVAERFVDWLDVPEGARWLDVGCGTGALSSRILQRARPLSVAGVDSSTGYLEVARERLGDAFDGRVGDAATLPFPGRSFDAVVSALLLNFLPDAAGAIAEQRRVSRDVVAAYVWDYAEGMELLRHFWDATGDAEQDEGERFPLAREDALRRLFVDAGLADVETRALEVPTVFRDFDDLWTPFLAGQGPAGAYAVALAPAKREELRERLRAKLDVAADGTIPLSARAWAVKGRVSAG